jgi:hypothetical protein
MINKLFFLAALLAPGLALGANLGANLSVQVVPAGGTSLQPPTVGPIPNGYNLDPAFSDEFNGQSIDLTKWYVGCCGVVSNDPCVIENAPGAAYESGGVLHQVVSINTGPTPPGCSGTSYLYPGTLATINTHKLPQNYFQEIRWKRPVPAVQLDPGFFTFGTSPGVSPADIAEVDDYEFGSINWFWNDPTYTTTYDSKINVCPGAWNGTVDGNFHVLSRTEETLALPTSGHLVSDAGRSA